MISNSSRLTRRQWMTSALATAMGSSLLSAEESSLLPEIVVDAHTHFYDPTRPEGVVWPPETSPLYRRVLLDDWKKVAAPCGVHHTIIVEASSRVEDNQWILELAEKDKSVLGYIGNLNPMDEAFESNLKRFAANPILKGLRVSERLLRELGHEPLFLRGLKQMAERGLCLEVNGSFRFLEPLHQVAQAIPNLRIMVDHMGGPGDAQSLQSAWSEGMKKLGQQTQVYCKVSGIPSQSARVWGEAPREHTYYQALFDHVWACFGEDRCVYGSDWPVSERGLPYDQMLAMVVEEIRRRSEPAKVAKKWFCDNSRRFYQWDLRN